MKVERGRISPSKVWDERQRSDGVDSKLSQPVPKWGVFHQNWQRSRDRSVSPGFCPDSTVDQPLRWVPDHLGGPAPPSEDQRERTQILALLSHLMTIVLGSLGIGEGNRFPKRSPHYPIALSST